MRVILYRNEPAMAMLRLPTKESNGRANLHQGGIGTGVDLETGETQPRRPAQSLGARSTPTRAGRWSGMRVPYWDEVIRLSRRVSEAVGLGYIGVDIVVDATGGPMLLEANARPGLAIQIANGKGLLPRLEAIDAMLDRPRIIPIESIRAARAWRCVRRRGAGRREGESLRGRQCDPAPLQSHLITCEGG